MIYCYLNIEKLNKFYYVREKSVEGTLDYVKGTILRETIDRCMHENHIFVRETKGGKHTDWFVCNVCGSVEFDWDGAIAKEQRI